MRILAALVIALLLFPFGAGQNPAGEACEGIQDGPHCKTLEVTSNGLAWMCRHAGGPPDGCDALDGRSITSAQVDAFVTSGTHEALAIKRLAEERTPLVSTTWLSTHNSFNAAWYNPTLSGLDPNQQYSMYDQLRMDIRGLEIDIHWVPSAADALTFAPIVCHGQGADRGHLGCTTETHLATVLPEIKLWLEENPDQVLMLDIQDELEHPLSDTVLAHDTAAATLDAVFGNLILRPEARGATCEDGLPLELSREDIRTLGKQIILVSGCGAGDAWPDMVHGKSNWVQQSTPLDGCQWDDETYATQWTRTWEDRTLVGEFAPILGLAGDGEPITAETLPFLVACSLNMISLDDLSPTDGRLGVFATQWVPVQTEPPSGDLSLEVIPSGNVTTDKSAEFLIRATDSRTDLGLDDLELTVDIGHPDEAGNRFVSVVPIGTAMAPQGSGIYRVVFTPEVAITHFATVAARDPTAAYPDVVRVFSIAVSPASGAPSESQDSPVLAFPLLAIALVGLAVASRRAG